MPPPVAAASGSAAPLSARAFAPALRWALALPWVTSFEHGTLTLNPEALARRAGVPCTDFDHRRCVAKVSPVATLFEYVIVAFSCYRLGCGSETAAGPECALTKRAEIRGSGAPARADFRAFWRGERCGHIRKRFRGKAFRCGCADARARARAHTRPRARASVRVRARVRA